jgi:peroxisome-assembly ATPase
MLFLTRWNVMKEIGFSNLKNVIKLCSTASSSNLNLGPIHVLKEKINNDELKYDVHQEAVAIALQQVFEQMKNYQPVKDESFFSFFEFGKAKKKSIMNSPKGLYIYGSVGGGKTMLMDLFFNCCTVLWNHFEHTDNKYYIRFFFFLVDIYSYIVGKETKGAL